MKRLLIILCSLIQTFSIAQIDKSPLSSANKLELNNIVNEWSEAHNNWDLKKFNELYASYVLFYCQQLNKEACISKKSSLFQPNEVFNQKIVSEIIYEQYTNGIVKASFTKKVKTNKKSKEYPSYLLIMKQDGIYKIVAESDLITDKNLKFKLDIENLILPSSKIKPAQLSGENNSNNTLIYSAIIIFFGVVGVLFMFYLKGQKKDVGTNDPIITKDDIIHKEEVVESLNVLSEKEINERKGKEFEKYISEKFPRPYFTWIDGRSDMIVNGNYPKTNLDPDLIFGFTHNGIEKKIAIECKWRKNLYYKTFKIDNTQFLRYKKFEVERKMPVYLVLGVGGSPDSPENLFCIPLAILTSNAIGVEILNKTPKAPLTKFHYYNDEQILK